MEEEHRDPADDLPVRQQLRIDEGLSIRRLEPELSEGEDAEHRRTDEQHPDHRRVAEDARFVGLGRDPSPFARLEDAEHDERQADDRQDCPDEVELLALGDRCICDPLDEQQDDPHDHDLGHEDIAPRGEGGDGSTDQGPDGDSDGTSCCDGAVGSSPSLWWDVARNQRDDGRHDQRSPDSLKERPPEDQDWQRRGDCGRGRACGIDHETDGEGLASPDHRPDLPASDHQGCHHERVEGDRGLDTGHRRVDVVGDL